jgi:ribosomal protein S21
MINVKVEKTGTENAMGLIRRFTKRVQGSGVLRRVRSNRYHNRDASPLARKERALRGIKKRAERLELIKLGKIAEQPTRRGGRR